jgi:hypothetical protein
MKASTFHGFREVACVLKGVSIDLPLKGLLDILFVNQPRMTGWPPWVDSRSFPDQRSHPYVKEKGWEALIYGERRGWAVKAVDFWRIEPTGRF